MADVLPNSIPKAENRRRITGPGGIQWVLIFCANCGADGGAVPEENVDFACYLCEKCAETYGAKIGEMIIPDQVFWTKVADEQLEKHGRLLSTPDLIEALKTDETLQKLVRDRDPKGR